MLNLKFSKDLLATLFLALVVSLFFLPLFSPGKILVTTGVIRSDWQNQNYPAKLVYQDALRGKASFFWNANLANGLPILGEGQIGHFYPFNLIFFSLFPISTAFTLSILAHFLIAALSTYLFVRLILKLSPVSALISSLSFALSGFFVIHLIHLNMLEVFAWIPLVFLILELLMVKKNYLLSFVSLTLIFACQFLAGHPSILFQITIVIALYLLARVFLSGKITVSAFLPVFIFAFAFILAAGLAAPQTLPTWEFTQASSRSTGLTFEEATSFLFPLKHLLTFLLPWKFDVIKDTTDNFLTGDQANLWETYGYIGLIPLVLVFLALIRTGKYLVTGGALRSAGRRTTAGVPAVGLIIFAVLTLFTLLLALGRTTPVFYFIWTWVPGAKLFRYPTRFMVLATFGLAILAAYGWQIIEEKIIKSDYNKHAAAYRLLSLPLIVVIIISADLCLTQWRVHQTADQKWWFKDLKTAEFLQKNLGLYRYYSFGTTNLKYSTARDLALQRQAQELLPANFNLFYQLSTNNFQSGILPETQIILGKAVKNRTQFDPKSLSLILNDDFLKILSLQGVKYLLSDLLLEHKDLQLVLTVNLDAQLTHIIPQVTAGGVEIKEIPTKNVYVYENKKVMPRAFLVGSLVQAGENWEKIDLSQADFSRTLFLPDQTQTPESLKDSKFKSGEAKITSYSDERVEIKTDSNTASFLVLTDSFYPGWQSTVDGANTPILRADYSFRAVAVPKGQHTITFSYQPQSFKTGLKISLVSLALFALSCAGLFVHGRISRAQALG